MVFNFQCLIFSKLYSATKTNIKQNRFLVDTSPFRCKVFNIKNSMNRFVYWTIENYQKVVFQDNYSLRSSPGKANKLFKKPVLRRTERVDFPYSIPCKVNYSIVLIHTHLHKF